MTTYQAQLDEERAAEAKRLGLSLWQYDMSRATPDRLLADIVGDARRSNPHSIAPTPQEPAMAMRQASADAYALQERNRLLSDPVREAIVCAGGLPDRVGMHIIHHASQLINEGSSPGGAAAVLFKQYRNLL